jgi:hypothetical protein
MGATLFGIADGVRTPVVSPTYLGLSSQPGELVEDEMTVGWSENLSPEIGPEANDPVFSEITIGGFIGVDVGGFTSILGGGMPVSRWKGASEMLGIGILGAGGPASRGVLKAFSQDPGRGSLGDGAIAAEKLGPARPGTERADDGGGVVGWTLSTLSSATWASRMRFLFIKFSNICKALSNRMPGRRPRWNLKASVIEKAAIITITAISTVVKESWGNLVSCSLSPALTDGLFA